MGITVNELMFTTVANDDSIELPIFQRGKVWSDEKKFGLVLSAILNYPVGAISILSEQISLDDGSIEIKIIYLMVSRELTQSNLLSKTLQLF